MSKVYYQENEQAGLMKPIACFETTKLSEALPEVCKEFSSNNLHLVGNANFIDGIVENIKQVNETKYNNFNLNIEVN